MSGDYLVLHKVRGKPALDIAKRGCVETKPCQPDCGGYNHETGECKFENTWTIPTSGHACRPYKWYPLEEWDFWHDTGLEAIMASDLANDPEWKALGDHYSVNDKAAGKGQGSGLNLMDLIKMPQPKINLVRRRV